MPALLTGLPLTLSMPPAVASLHLAAKIVSLFLFQRISVTMQRFNAILLHNCCVRDDQDF